MILLIDNYDSFTYNLFHYLGELGAEARVVRNDEISADEALALKPDGIVLSPGPCSPNEAGICMDVIRKADGQVPILGVCLGHQAMGQAEGGKVIRAKTLMHGKTDSIQHTGAGVFKDIPSPFTATRYHSLAIERASLPDTLEVTAWTDDGEIMGVQHKHRPMFGVQFHPESIATQYGHEMLANFLDLAGVDRSSQAA